MNTELQIHPRHSDLDLRFLQTPGGPTEYALKKVEVKESVKNEIARATQTAKAITQVTDDDELIEALEAITNLKHLTGGLEASRVRYKDPFLKGGQLIDAAAKLVNGPANIQLERLQDIAGKFDGARRREAEAEQRRLEQQSREINAAAQTATTPERKEMLEEVAHQTHLQARAIDTTTISRTRLRWKADETAIEWSLLEANYPHMVKKELKKTILNDVINSLEESGFTINEHSIPGLRLMPDDKAIGL